MPPTLPAGKPPGQATRPPEPATPSAKSRVADAQLSERKRKVAPSAGLPKKKKKGKTRSPPAEPEKKPVPLLLERAWTPGDEVQTLEATVRAARPPDPAKSKHAPSAKSREADAQLPVRKKNIAPSADPPQKNDKSRSAPAEPEKKSLPSDHAWAWTPSDEVQILEALVAYRQEHGKLPRTKALLASLQLQGRLDSKGFSLQDLRQKVRSLKGWHDYDAINGVPAKEHKCSLCHLSKTVWGTIPEPVATSGGEASTKVPNAGKTFGEMCQLYPWLTDEMTHIVDEPAVLERLLLDFDDTKARALDSKIDNLRKELTEAIMESAKRQNLEVPKVWQCQCTRLQPAKSRAQNENMLLLERLDKIGEMQEQLKRIESGMAELKPSSKASKPAPKVIRCNSAASAPHSVVAEKQFSGNVLQKKIEVQGKLPHCKNGEVTSKYRPPGNLRKPILASKSILRARNGKIDAESQILNYVEKMKVVACAQKGFSHDLNVEGKRDEQVPPFVPELNKGSFCI
ncbi:uncharacterized protein LOC123402084 isoform X4 [Hordeum vulgare subsp. vulgare]|uniref:uncharacterized protein LOC123402084 isoform X4 n=1 Tax=Hordeum vulgare subsp. vulgare TaxID=112509 RepID=UPI001D1A510B|nr:uncharacterized protein LOC123402084 isoform X4 [Hordeum vulgare subsp. vulgare]